MKKILQLLLLSIFVIKVANAQSSFTGKPRYNILTIQNGDTIGITTVELFPNIAPLHVANFDSLANVHFFDSTAFHRVIPGFMIQGGDPNSRHGPISTWGFGDPLQPTVNAEFSAAKHIRGTLSAARDADTNSANSQFFICVAASSWLNGDYSVYGRVVSGMNFVDTVVSAPRDTNDNPLDKIEMFVNYIGSNDSVPNAPLLNSPVSGSFSASTSRVLKWITQLDGITYHLEVATDSVFNNIIKNIESSSSTYNASGLTPLTKYFWRIRTNNGGHFSNYSEVWNFYVSAVGINDIETNSNNITVAPNPSKGVFTFHNIGLGSHIVILNVEGKIVFEALGYDNILQIDFNDKQKGIYFYKVKTIDGFIEKGKLVVE
jgi:cyclophilin family peptidyl-prolyl cis-trans isomerase